MPGRTCARVTGPRLCPRAQKRSHMHGGSRMKLIGPALVRTVEFVAIALQVLVVGAFWGSWIGLSRSINTLTPATFVEVGHVMMEDYGPIMSVLMPAAVVVTLLAGVLVYKRHALAGLLILVGCACTVAATAITLIVNVPIDVMISGWT